MKAFYILKPDAIQRKEVIKEYQTIINSIKYIKNRYQFEINSWIDLSYLIYEPSNKNIQKEELLKIKQQLLTTIKGYNYLFQNNEAIIDIFDIPDDLELLKELEKIKYQIRKQYVLNTPKNYIKFLNLPENTLEKELKNIDIRNLEISHIKTNYNEEINLPNYQLAYLNCIHFPDSNIESINRDFDIIESSNILTKKIKL